MLMKTKLNNKKHIPHMCLNNNKMFKNYNRKDYK